MLNDGTDTKKLGGSHVAGKTVKSYNTDSLENNSVIFKKIKPATAI